jgi:putative cell wall-binding protein
MGAGSLVAVPAAFASDSLSLTVEIVRGGELRDAVEGALEAQNPAAPGGTIGEEPTLASITNLTITGSVAGDALADDDVAVLKELTALTTLDLTGLAGLQRLNPNALEGLAALESVALPASLTTIGASAFSGCSALKQFSAPGLRTLEASAFNGCARLAGSLSLPEVTQVGAYAFQGCSSLTTLSLPRIQSIGANAFLGANALKTLVLPATPPALSTAGLGTGQRALTLWVPQKDAYYRAGFAPGTSLRLIAINPAEAYVTQGQTIRLEAQCEDPAATAFQWYRNGVLLPGQNSATLTIAAAGYADAGSYTLTINGLDLPLSSTVVVTAAGQDGIEGEGPEGEGPTRIPVVTEDPVTATRIAGEDRYATAVAIALHGRSSAPTVFLASGNDSNYPDALIASGIAGIEGNAPVLLTEHGSLPASVRTALTALGTQKVVIVGGSSAVSLAVEAGLRSWIPLVERISGADRQQTAEEAYLGYSSRIISMRAMAEGLDSWSRTAIIATHASYADSLSIAPWAHRSQSALFFTDGLSNGLTERTRAILAQGGFDRIVVLGGTGAVSDTAANQALTAAGLARNAQCFVRLGGTTRYTTSIAIAKWTSSAGRGGSERLNFNTVALASGDRHADALAGGALQGMAGSVLLLTSEGAKGLTTSFLGSHATEISEIRVLGGNAALSEGLMQDHLSIVPRAESARG